MLSHPKVASDNKKISREVNIVVQMLKFLAKQEPQANSIS